jgi:preprotein translocase subunit YajC
VNYLPILLIAVFLIAAMSLARRNRARVAAAQVQQREQIGFGTDVQTTSGLYGTVVGLNGDDTVQLAIAPGVEVKWALAALRDVDSLPGPVGPAGHGNRGPAIENESSESAEPTEPTEPGTT